MEYIENLDEIQQKELIPGYKVKFIHSQNMTFAYWDITAGAELPEHSHPHEQVGTMISGEFEFTINNKKQALLKL